MNPSVSENSAIDSVEEMMRLRREKSGALKEILGELVEYEQRQDERMKGFLDYTQTWIEKQKDLASG